MLKDCTISRAALIVNPRRHRLDRELTTGARQQTGVDGSETHVRVLGGIQVLRGAARHEAGHKRDAVIADCNRIHRKQELIQLQSQIDIFCLSEFGSNTINNGSYIADSKWRLGPRTAGSCRERAKNTFADKQR